MGNGWEAPLNGDLGMTSSTSSVQLKCCHALLLTCCYTTPKFEGQGVGWSVDFFSRKMESLYNIVALISDKAFTVYLFLSSGLLPAGVLCQVSSSHSGDFLLPVAWKAASTTSS